jgi:hypothetical protein
VCVVLCATRMLTPGFDIANAQRERLCVQLITVNDSSELHDSTSSAASAASDSSIRVLEALPRVMKRSAWIQAHCRRIAKIQDSSQDWQKALDAIANSWRWLLALVGLRW